MVGEVRGRRRDERFASQVICSCLSIRAINWCVLERYEAFWLVQILYSCIIPCSSTMFRFVSSPKFRRVQIANLQNRSISETEL